MDGAHASLEWKLPPHRLTFPLRQPPLRTNCQKTSPIEAAIGTMDGIINAISAYHPLALLLHLQKTHGKMIMVGAPDKPLELDVDPLVLVGGLYLAVSSVG